MPVRTKRWNDPPRADDGFRLLICRLRPRGVSKADETWDDWWQDLGPTRELLDAFHGKHGPPLDWESYAARYLDELRGPAATWMIRDLGRRCVDGETITLLCSSACTNPERCHRTLLAGLISPQHATNLGGPAPKHGTVSQSPRLHPPSSRAPSLRAPSSRPPTRPQR